MPPAAAPTSKEAATRALSSERGLTLIEVVISAALMIVLAMGLFLSFDAGSHLASQDQRRSEANDLAQQDQDRIKGLSVSQLATLNQTRTVTLDNTPFTITSTGQFYTASTGSQSCSATGSADYIKTTSTVTWPTMGSRPPVVAEGVVAPPEGGALIVQVTDSRGNGVANMAVTGTGAQSLSATTSSNGCAIFAGLSAGTYNISVAQPGYVDKDGNTSPPSSQQATTVIAGSSVTKTFSYDKAGSLAVTFQTKPYGSSSWVNSNADTVVLFNNNMSYPGFRWAGTLNSYQSTINATNLFPFTSAYTVYAGSCAADAPSANGASQDPTATIPQGGSAALTLQLPALNLTVYNGSTSAPGQATSYPHVVLTDQNCGGSPLTQGGTPLVKRTPATTSGGQLANPGLPYGTYTVCADNGTYYAQQTYVANKNLSGTTLNLYLNTNSRYPNYGKCS